MAKRKLTKAQRRDLVEVVRSLATGAVDKVEFARDPYDDDHILCADLLIGPEKVPVTLPWCGWEICAAALYCTESAKAMADLREYVNEQLREATDNAEGGMTDEEIVDNFRPW